MSAKRVVSSSLDWAAFTARVPPNQIPQFKAFKAKCDGYLRDVANRPESLPKIHWDQYKTRITIPGMVEEFQKRYESLQIPYPEDKFTSAINGKEKEAMEDVKKFVAESEARIAEYQKELAHFENMIPFDEMTLEDFADYCPELALNLEKPTLWPHTPEAQPGYKDDTVEEEHH